MIARLSCLKPSGGHLQLNSGTSKHPQRSRIQLSRSTLWLMEKASAEMVDLTTLEIFFEDQIKGDSGPLRFWSRHVDVAQIKWPWNELKFFGLAKEASPNEMWVTSSGVMDRNQVLVSLCSWASRKTLFAKSMVPTVGLDSWHWTSPSLEAMSGLVCVTAYWMLPMIPLSFDNSVSVKSDSGCSRRFFPISMAMIPWTYASWEAEMDPSGCCSKSIPVNLNLRSLNEPKGNRRSSSLSCFRKNWSPPPRPSPTWVPNTPCKTKSLPFPDDKKWTHGSRGWVWKLSSRRCLVSSR